jgi:hypothetical protein
MREIDDEPVFSDAASDLCKELILWLIRSTNVKTITACFANSHLLFKKEGIKSAIGAISSFLSLCELSVRA